MISQTEKAGVGWGTGGVGGASIQIELETFVPGTF